MALEYFPTAQSMQVETDIAPGLVEYLPAGHGMHDDEWMLPCVVEYFPAEQFWHVNAAVSGENLPCGHSSQSVSASLPSVDENLPCTHSVQMVDPEMAE